MPQTRRNYGKEFKLDVINDRNSGMSLSDVASKYSVHTTQVHDWTGKYNEIGADSFIDIRGKYNSPLRGRPKKNFISLEEELGLPSLEDLTRR